MMAVTTDNIRDLLNRPRGLNDATITELIALREAEVNKIARKADKYGVSSDNAPDTTLKESATKMLVALDCLTILIDTVPAYYSESERSVYDRRYQEQAKAFEKRAEEFLALIAEPNAAAFATGKTTTRLTGA